MKIINSYLRKTYIKPFILCTLCFVGIYLIIDLLNKVDDIQEYAEKKGLGTSEAFEFGIKVYLAKIPHIFAILSPFIALMSAIWVVATLIRQNEYTGILAAGISVYKIMSPLLAITILVGAINLLNKELLLTYIEKNNLAEINSKNRDRKTMSAISMAEEFDFYKQKVSIGTYYRQDVTKYKKDEVYNLKVTRSGKNDSWKLIINGSYGKWLPSDKKFVILDGQALMYADLPGDLPQNKNIGIFQIAKIENSPVLTLPVQPGSFVPNENEDETYTINVIPFEVSDKKQWNVQITTTGIKTDEDKKETFLVKPELLIESDHGLTLKIKAEKAVLSRIKRYNWLFYWPRLFVLDDNENEIEIETYVINSNITPEETRRKKLAPQALRFDELCDKLNSNDKIEGRHKLAVEMWGRIGDVFTHVIIVTLGLVIMFLYAHRNTLIGIAASIGACVLIYMVIFFFKSWGVNGDISPFFAVMGPLGFFCTISFFLYLKVQT